MQYSRTLDNQSSYPLWAIYQHTGKRDSLLLPPFQKSTLFRDGGLGRVRFFQTCESLGSYMDFQLAVQDSADRTVHLDPGVPSHWEFITVRKNLAGGGICECRLTITDELIY